MQTQCRGNEDVGISRLDFLHDSRVQIHQLCQLLLRQLFIPTSASDIFPKAYQDGMQWVGLFVRF